jgi:hypothetical protein
MAQAGSDRRHSYAPAVASAFISYAHEDQEFVLALVERLQAQGGLDIRYDRVVLHIGDSLIHAISQEVIQGDFLIAVVSPDSVESEWCQHELALAKTQGINERRVKVLPVKFRGAAMPPMLHDTFWGDADRDDVETLARRLAAAMTANLEGRDADAAQDAEAAEQAEGEPAHAEVAGDVTVAQLDAVADKVWDTLWQWAEMWAGSNVREVVDKQRRLRWALDFLPERVQVGLPLVNRLANSGWDEFFAETEPDAVEPDIREELRSVRTQLAQGLPVTKRWVIDGERGTVDVRRDAVAYLWQVRRGDKTRPILVYISRTAVASADEHLPREVAQAKATNGRSVVVTLLALDDPPEEVSVTTAGISQTMPD